MATFGNQGGGFNAGTNWGAGTQRPAYAPQQTSRTSAPVATQRQQQIQPQNQDGNIDYSALLGALPLVSQLVSGAFSDQGSIADALSGSDGRYLSPQAEGLLSMAASQAGKYSGLDPHIGGFIPSAISLLNGNTEGALRQAAGTGAGMLASELLPGAARGLAGPLATLASGLVGGDSQGQIIENVGNSVIGAIPGFLGAHPAIGLAYGAARMLGLNPMKAITPTHFEPPTFPIGTDPEMIRQLGGDDALAVYNNPELLETWRVSPSDVPTMGLDASGLNITDSSNRSGLQIAPLSSYESQNWKPSDIGGEEKAIGEGSFGGSLRDAFGPIKTASDELSGAFGVNTPDYNPYDSNGDQGIFNQRGEYMPVGTQGYEDLSNPELNAYAGFYDQYANDPIYDTPDYLAYNPGSAATYSPEYQSMFSPELLAALGQSGFENPYGTLLQNYGWEQTAPATSGYYEGHEGQTWIPESSSWGTTSPGYWMDTDNYNLMQNGHYQWDSQDAMRSGAAPISLWNPEGNQTTYFNNPDEFYVYQNQGSSVPPNVQNNPNFDFGPPVLDVPAGGSIDYGMYQPDIGGYDANGDPYSYADQNANNNFYDTWN